MGLNSTSTTTTAIVLAMLLVAGCASTLRTTPSRQLASDGEAGACAAFFVALDRVTGAAGVHDVGESRIAGFPYLRVNRLLAALRDEAASGPAFNDWLDRLQKLSDTARALEVANLPANSWHNDFPRVDRATLAMWVRHCTEVLRAEDVRDPAQRDALREGARVEDEYETLPRILGLYPLSSVFVAQGVRRWHKNARERFTNAPPSKWRAREYVLYSAEMGAASDHANVQRMLLRSPRDALGLPHYSDEVLNRLFRHYAPRWVIHERSDDDRIGAAVWKSSAEPRVQVGEPVTYTRLSFARFNGELLTQLNYIVWFPARTAQVWPDIYAGPLDGLNLRITLRADGEPLLYESIHNCGCYYKAYPTSQLRIRENIDYAEPPLILAAPALDPAIHTLAVGLQSATHYVEHLFAVPRDNAADGRSGNMTSNAGVGVGGVKTYVLRDYAVLRSLAQANGERRSLFDVHGMIPISVRPERFLLWPTGVRSPGAMRQWGRHPVAFVGERHFDDADALDRMFIPAPAGHLGAEALELRVNLLTR
jgi:hypothetical protein